MNKAFGAVLLLALGGASALASSPRGLTSVDPRDYRSADRAFTLRVDPTDPEGEGPADYRLELAGTLIWSNRLPFAFRNAVVATNGFVAGYAFVRRARASAGQSADLGEFVVAILSPTGEVSAEHREPCTNSPYLHNAWNPDARGLVLMEAAGRFAVRVASTNVHEGSEDWRFFDLANGAFVGVMKPRTAAVGEGRNTWIRDARGLPGLPLALLHWWKSDGDAAGARFSVIDEAGREHWTLDLDGDYAVPGDDDAEIALREEIRTAGALLSVQPGGRFELRAVRAKERVTYEVARNGRGGWEGRKSGSAPYRAAKPAAPPLLSTNTVLEQLGSFALEGRPAANSNASVYAFAFDDRGRICARDGSGPGSSLRLLTQQGEVLGAVELPSDPGTTNEFWMAAGPAWVGGDRFVVSLSARGAAQTAFVYRVDFAGGSLTRLASGDVAPIAALTGFPDGRFAALTKRSSRYSMTDGLSFFASDGTRVWHLEEGGFGGADADMLSPQDLTAVGSNAVAVVDNIRHTIQIFGWDGRLERFIDLDKVCSRKLQYPTHLAPDGEDGFLVYDFDTPDPLIRIGPDGILRSAVAPRYAGGQRISISDGVQRAPGGSLWTCDGETLIRLGDNGQAEFLMSGTVDADALSQPSAIRITEEGRVYVGDARTRVIHVFSPEGRRLARCRPLGVDIPETAHVEHIAVDGRGHVVATLGTASDVHLEFAADGSLVRDLMSPWDTITEERYFQPGRSRCWVLGFRQVYLLDEEGRLERTVARRPDGRWLTQMTGAAVAADGSLAAMITDSRSEGCTLHVYNASGAPLRSVTVPPDLDVGFSGFAFDGRRFFSLRDTDLLALDIEDGSAVRATFPEGVDARAFSQVFTVRGGKELWFLDMSDFTVHRFAAPKIGTG